MATSQLRSAGFEITASSLVFIIVSVGGSTNLRRERSRGYVTYTRSSAAWRAENASLCVGESLPRRAWVEIEELIEHEEEIGEGMREYGIEEPSECSSRAGVSE